MNNKWNSNIEDKDKCQKPKLNIFRKEDASDIFRREIFETRITISRLSEKIDNTKINKIKKDKINLSFCN